MKENIFRGTWNRLLQKLARELPGKYRLRTRLHRWRGVTIGERVWIGYDCIIESSAPELVTIGDDCEIMSRVLIVAHAKEVSGVKVGRRVTIGAGAIILPNVTIGDDSVIAAGSVVTRSVPPRTFVQGNPAKPVARIGKPLGKGVTMREFMADLRPMRLAEPAAPPAVAPVHDGPESVANGRSR